MVKVPGFLLKRLYVKGTLRNTRDGFEFQLKNTLGSGYARKVLPLTMDGVEVPLASTSFTQNGNEVSFTAVEETTPFTLAMNKSTTVKIKGAALSPGPHKVSMSFEVQGLGVLNFDFTDMVENDGSS